MSRMVGNENETPTLRAGAYDRLAAGLYAAGRGGARAPDRVRARDFQYTDQRLAPDRGRKTRSEDLLHRDYIDRFHIGRTIAAHPTRFAGSPLFDNHAL